MGMQINDGTFYLTAGHLTIELLEDVHGDVAAALGKVADGTLAGFYVSTSGVHPLKDAFPDWSLTVPGLLITPGVPVALTGFRPEGTILLDPLGASSD